MVFRKPYAFLIKNFKKIHILLVVLCAYIYYKTMSTSSFTTDFLNFLSYDPYYEPIKKYVGFFLLLVIIIVIVINGMLLILLRRKDKPWKLYLIPILEYIALFFVLISIRSFFNSYTGDLSTTSIRLLNNMLFITTIPQYIVFLILLIRVIGLDLKNFNFSADEEFLDLSQDDREEFEVSVEFDKYALLRLLRKTQRALIYFYQEHRYFCNIFFVVATIFLLGNIYYYFGVAHKVIKENQTNTINNYQITIHKSYYTDKGKTGDVLEKDSAFVILNMTVVNKGAVRVFNPDDFRLVNGRSGYSFAGDTYNNDFLDIGKGYPKGKLQYDEKKNFILVFKVDKKLDPKRFVLYYQEYKNATTSYLRKIKLSLNDASDVLQNSSNKLGEEITIVYPNKEEKSLTFREASLESSVEYTSEVCNKDDECEIIPKNYTISEDKKILVINFSSNDYEGEELIDFSTKYGKIVYRDNENITREWKVENAINSSKYLGKYLYIKVPNALEEAKEIEFIYTIRNQKYIYKIR